MTEPNLPTWRVMLHLARYRPLLFLASGLLASVMFYIFPLIPGLIVRQIFNGLTGEAPARFDLWTLIALLAGATLLAHASGPGTPAPAARLVRASIAVDGQVVLLASTSDDGHPDADQVWSYLLERLEFQPTDAFPSS